MGQTLKHNLPFVSFEEVIFIGFESIVGEKHLILFCPFVSYEGATFYRVGILYGTKTHAYFAHL